MFNKQKKNSTGYVVEENFTPAILSSYSPETEYVPTDYRILNHSYKAKFYKSLEERLTPIISKMDKHNSGKELHGIVRSQVSHLRDDFNQDAALIQFQAERIINVKESRNCELENEKIRLSNERDQNLLEMQPLRNCKSQYEIKIMGYTIPTGLIVTIIAMLVDIISNYAFLQEIVTMGQPGFFVVLLSMAVMSDCSMAALGVLLSKTEHTYINQTIRKALICSLVFIFFLSAVAGPMIRFGSMDLQYGTFASDGNLIPKKGDYTLAEIGVTMITSFLTLATGILSFIFSYDKEREKAVLYKSLKSKNNYINARIDDIVVAQEYIKRSIPIINNYNKNLRETAAKELEAMEKGLLSKATLLWAEHIGTPETFEIASDVINEITEAPSDSLNLETIENPSLNITKLAG